MDVIRAIWKVIASILIIPVGIIMGMCTGAALLVLLVLATPIHFIEAIWSKDNEFLDIDKYDRQEKSYLFI